MEYIYNILEPSFGRQRTRASKPVSSTVPIDENVEVTSAAPKPNFAERYTNDTKIICTHIISFNV